MALETASFVANLVTANPDGGDQRSTADDHIRLIKACLRRSFPLVDAAVSLSAAQFHYNMDLSASVQLQLNQLRDGSATANNAINSRYATSASNAALALTANSASYATFAGRAESASFATFAGTATLALTANSASYAATAGHAATATSATTATTAGTATTAASATTATTASSANAVGGYAPSEAVAGSTLAARNSSGHLFAAYFNQSSAQEGGTPNNVIVTVGDSYFRKVAPNTLGAAMSAQNITGRAGVNKTLQAGSGPPSLAGSTNGDLFYYY